MVSVAATETGMVSQDIDRIINPLFGTKSDGMGMGLFRSIIKARDKARRAVNTASTVRKALLPTPAGAPGANLEPCDFLSKTKQFIHLKDGHSSAPISHLWNQGVVSAESFVRDEKFQIDLRKAAKKRQKQFKKTGFDVILPDGRSKPMPADYTVVFAIMSDRYKKTGTISIPFFSKVSLRAVAERIQLMGFTVEVHLVERL